RESDGAASVQGFADVQLELNLTGARGLAELWTGPTRVPDDAAFQQQLWEELRYPPGERPDPTAPGPDLPPELRRQGELEGGFVVGAGDAAALAARQNLLNPLCLEIEAEECIVAAALGLEPRDDEAAAVFALDDLVRRVLLTLPDCTRKDLDGLTARAAARRADGPPLTAG